MSGLSPGEYDTCHNRRPQLRRCGFACRVCTSPYMMQLQYHFSHHTLASSLNYFPLRLQTHTKNRRTRLPPRAIAKWPMESKRVDFSKARSRTLYKSASAANDVERRRFGPRALLSKCSVTVLATACTMRRQRWVSVSSEENGSQRHGWSEQLLLASNNKAIITCTGFYYA